MIYKKLLRKFFLIILGLCAFLVIPFISYDSLHLYHKSWFFSEDKLHGNMRLQAAGIINNYEFDSMIVGTSMLKGTSERYASKNLGGKFVNISADASNLYERNLFLKHALATKDIKHVIYSFDTGLDANLKKNNRTLPLNKFNYLYDDNPFNDFYAYWNNKFLTCLLTFSDKRECIGGNRGLIRSEKWVNKLYKTNKKISGIQQWISKDGRGKNIYPRIKKHLSKPLTEVEYTKKLILTHHIIDTQLVDTIKKYPQVEFHIVMPPYSRLFYSIWFKYNPKKYKLYQETVKYLTQASMKYSNMHIYLLDDLDYLDDLGNYRDMRHYNTDMNLKIVDYVVQKKYIKSMDELQILFQKINKKNMKYANKKLDEDIKTVLDAYAFKYNVDTSCKNNYFTINGWVLSYKVTSVELYKNNKNIKRTRLKKRQDIYNKYPRYKQLKSGFIFKNIPLTSSKDKYKLVFRNKNRIIKTKSIIIRCEKEK